MKKKKYCSGVLGGYGPQTGPKFCFWKKNQKSCFEKIQKSCFEKSTLGTFLIFFMKLKQHKIVKVERNSFFGEKSCFKVFRPKTAQMGQNEAQNSVSSIQA